MREQGLFESTDLGDRAPHWPSVDIVHRRDHEFAKREKRGCGECGKGKHDIVHRGYPPSLNISNKAGGWTFYHQTKGRWQELFERLLFETSLPKGLGSVLAEGQVVFPDRIARDQGNARYFIEKALGDALEAGGYLERDDWSRFEFGRLRAIYVKGEAAMAITLHPSPERFGDAL